MNEVLKCLVRISGLGYHVEEFQEIIAKAKAATDMPEEAKAEIIAVAEKALIAENKRNEAIAALLSKYNTAENITPEEDDEDDGYF